LPLVDLLSQGNIITHGKNSEGNAVVFTGATGKEKEYAEYGCDICEGTELLHNCKY